MHEFVSSKSRLSFEHVVDGTRQCMSEESQCVSLAVFFLQSREALLSSGVLPQEEDRRFGEGPLAMRIAD